MATNDDVAKLRAEFDEWADSYDASMVHPNGILMGYAEARNAAARLLPIRQGDAVLDIGVGTGLFGELFAARGAQVLGVDVSPRMLAVCAAKHPGWTYREGHFLALPAASASQDWVVSAFASHHLPPADWEPALAEVMRVLRTDGRFLLVDILFGDERAKDAVRQELSAQGQWEEEPYPVYDQLRQVAAAMALDTEWTPLTPLHGAVVFQRTSPA